MSFAADLVAQLEHATAGQPVPRVRALHLPPAEAAASKSGEFCALELDDGALGLSYVLLDHTLQRLIQSGGGEGLVGMEALELARAFAAPSGRAHTASQDPAQELRRTLGFAACNALSRTVMDRMGFAPPRATDSIGGIAPQAGDHVGMVGLFSPLLKQVTAAGARLTVVELNPDYAGQYDGYHVTLDAAELQGCNKVLSTSTILLNHTVDDMLAQCRGAERIVLIGPSAGCVPDPLFARGVTLMGGSWITDRAGFIDALRRGDPWSAFAYKFALTASDWPGR
ncbi:Rossmann-like domain-containing protein [Thauera sp. AutoDN2]|uniref:Rossmann-like domain-containing protein n=1 Tax=Thauera sp. AutoDN2 TaxID=3416051 RepID=UPI003F4AFB55